MSSRENRFEREVSPPPVFDDRDLPQEAAGGDQFDFVAPEEDDLEMDEFLNSPGMEAYFERIREWMWIIRTFYNDGSFDIGEDFIFYIPNDPEAEPVELP